MSIEIDATTVSGKTLFATAQQTSGGVLGDRWNVTSSQWEAVVAIADAKISLTEGTAENIQSYTGGVATTMGTYTGFVLVRIHDDDAGDVTIGSQRVYLSSGVETSIGTVVGAAVSPVIVTDDRTWLLRDAGEYSLAPERVQLSVGSTATLAMDFGQRINPGTDLTGTPAAIVDTVKTGTAPGLSNVAFNQSRTQVHVDAVAAVSGKYRLKVTATTTDGQTLVGYGWLDVE